MATRNILVTVATAVAVLVGGGARPAWADMLPGAITGVTGTGHQQGDSASGDGSIRTTLDGTGLSYDAVDGRYEHTNRWQDDWQGGFGGGSPSFASAGWLVMDLQKVYASGSTLGHLSIWNANEGTHTDRGTQDFDIYYAASLDNGVPATGTSYDFTTDDPGWAKLNSAALTLPQASGSSGQPVSGVFDITGIPSARYLGLDILSNYGSTFRVGFAEIQVTTVPEPSTFLLATLGLLGLGFVAWRRSGRC